MDKRKNDNRQDYSDNLRRRALEFTVAGFQEREIVEFLLTFAHSCTDVRSLADQLLRRFGSLVGITRARVADLLNVPGVEEDTAVLLSNLKPLYDAYFHALHFPARKYSSREVLARNCLAKFRDASLESLLVLCLDVDNQVTDVCMLEEGLSIDVRKYLSAILEIAERDPAGSIVVVHDFPDGVAIPNLDDVVLAMVLEEKLMEGGVNRKMADYFILMKDDYCSFWEEGALLRTADRFANDADKPHPWPEDWDE